MRILINTMHGDIHALAVTWALRERGHEVVCIRSEEFPARVKGTIRIPTQERSEVIWDGLERLGRVPFDAIWNRRFLDAEVSEELHPADRTFAKREARLFNSAALELSQAGVFEVNPRDSRVPADLKPVQLTKAKKAGLRIPDTIITNDPAEVAKFFDKHEGKIVYKNFSPHAWATAHGDVMNLTADFLPHMLQEIDSISFTSGIYQEKIYRQTEFRIVVIGHTVFVTEMVALKVSAADTRDRTAPRDGTSKFPKSVIEKCLALMEELDICFGCFDFVVGQNGGEPYFLEVNEMGQWLNIERLIPRFRMLDAFCGLLTSRSKTYVFDPADAKTRFRDYIRTPDFKKRSLDELVLSRDMLLRRDRITVETI